MPNALDSYSKAHGRSSVFLKLLQRSIIAIVCVLLVVIFLGVLPHPSLTSGRHASNNAVLRQVLELHRHGERSPVRWFGFEGDWAWASTDVSIGKLTVHGMHQAFKVGQHLQRMYTSGVAVTDPSARAAVAVPPSAINVYSTNYDRTVDTANALILGLLSPLDTDVNEVSDCGCRPEHGTRSIPACIAECLSIDTMPTSFPHVQVLLPEASPLLYQTSHCEGWREWDRMLEQGQEWRSQRAGAFSDASELVERIIGDSSSVSQLAWPGGECEGCVDTSNADFNYVSFMEAVWSNLVCYTAIDTPYWQHGDPEVSNTDMMATLQPVAEYVWRQRYAPSIGKNAGGMLLYEWLEALENTAKTSALCTGRKSPECVGAGSSPPIAIYSAHDTTVFSLLAALGVTNLHSTHLPGFTAHVVVELVEVSPTSGTDGFSVRVWYDDKKLTGIKGCASGECSLTTFLQATRSSAMPPGRCEFKQRDSDELLTTCDVCE